METQKNKTNLLISIIGIIMLSSCVLAVYPGETTYFNITFPIEDNSLFYLNYSFSGNTTNLGNTTIDYNSSYISDGNITFPISVQIDKGIVPQSFQINFILTNGKEEIPIEVQVSTSGGRLYAKKKLQDFIPPNLTIQNQSIQNTQNNTIVNPNQSKDKPLTVLLIISVLFLIGIVFYEIFSKKTEPEEMNKKEKKVQE
jgi:uncharacterized membrane protein